MDMMSTWDIDIKQAWIDLYAAALNPPTNPTELNRVDVARHRLLRQDWYDLHHEVQYPLPEEVVDRVIERLLEHRRFSYTGGLEPDTPDLWARIRYAVWQEMTARKKEAALDSREPPQL